jgi:hypothetical protein
MSQLELDLLEQWRPIPGHDGYEASDRGRQQKQQAA